MNYKELIQQRAALDLQIQEARRVELSGAIEKIRSIAEEFGLNSHDIWPTRTAKKNGNAGVKVAPKYRDPMTNATWTGRGKPPAWIKDKNREDFAI